MKNKTLVIAYGRANPVTAGHAKVFNKVKQIGDKLGGDHKVILSHTQDGKKNPLQPADKVRFAKKVAPGVNIEHSTKEHPTIMHQALKAHQDGVEHLHVVAGSDRVEEYKKLMDKYHGPESKHPFKSVTVHSAGERDPDAEGDTGISGTKMRQHASNNDIESYKKGLPAHIKHHEAKEMMDDVRKGMNLHESVQEENLDYDEEYAKMNGWSSARMRRYARWQALQCEEDKLNKPYRTPGEPKKFAVKVKNSKGNVVTVRYGDPKLSIKRDDPDRKAAFRARHDCDNATDKTSPKYWSCKNWSNKPVSKVVEDGDESAQTATPTKKVYSAAFKLNAQGRKVHDHRIESLQNENEMNTDNREPLSEAIDRMERMARKMRMRRRENIMHRRAEIASKRMPSMDKLKDRARKLAVRMLKERIGRKPVAEMSIAERQRVEERISRMPAVVERIARKMLPKVKQHTMQRIRSAHAAEAQSVSTQHNPRMESVEGIVKGYMSERLWEMASPSVNLNAVKQVIGNTQSREHGIQAVMKKFKCKRDVVEKYVDQVIDQEG